MITIDSTLMITHHHRYMYI